MNSLGRAITIVKFSTGLMALFLLISGKAHAYDPPNRSWTQGSIGQIATGVYVLYGPSVVSSAIQWDQEYYVIGTDNNMYFSADDLLPNWTNLGRPSGEYFASSPSCASWDDRSDLSHPDRVDCFVRLNNGEIWTIWRSRWKPTDSRKGFNDWDAQYSNHGNPGVSSLVGRPEIVAYTTKGLYLLAVNALGEVWAKHYAKKWSSWFSLKKPSGTYVRSSPSCVAQNYHRIDCFFYGNDGHVWTLWWNGNYWSNNGNDWPAGSHDHGAPSCTIAPAWDKWPSVSTWTSVTTLSLDVFANCYGYGYVAKKAYLEGSGWSGWEQENTVGLYGNFDCGFFNSNYQHKQCIERDGSYFQIHTSSGAP